MGEKVPLLCRLFGHAPSTYRGTPAYGRVNGGNVDGIGREHYSLYLDCDRCGELVEVGKFHGPLGEKLPCTCYRCTKERVEATPPGPDDLFCGHDMRMGRMFLCQKCGNKRCPHAADHRHTCTRSNEPGQYGSLYEDQP